MGILLGCGEGLIMPCEPKTVLPCPLHRPDFIAHSQGRLAALDNAEHLLWLGGEVYPADTGVEAMLLLPGGCLTLSGDTDCLTLHDTSTGTPLLTAPVGVYPQDMCLVAGGELLAVCGGSDGTVRLLTAHDLQTVKIAHVPGSAQRIDASRGWLHVLCLTEDDGLKSLLCRVPLRGERYEPVAALPGIPGAVRADESGGLWAAASEMLYHFPPEGKAPDRILPGFGLIRHMDCGDGWLLVTDPVMELCALISRQGERRILYEGDVGQALWI